MKIEQKEQVIYLDNNATTKIDQRVLEAMMPFLTTEFANASSTHRFGIFASEAVKNARKKVADLINAEQYEIVFTSGSTESINLALKGVAEKYRFKGKHIVTVSTEHSAVLDVYKYLETKGFEATYLDVNSEGIVDLNDVKSAVRRDTILVSVMYANNETGVIQPIKEISEIAHEVGAIFFSDATQAVGKIPVNVDEDGIDLLCLSGHKLYAPKGIGALFIRQRLNPVKIPALLHGGGHEKGIRSGTLNVPGIVGLGEACEIAKRELLRNASTVGKLRDNFESELLKIEGVSINGSMSSRLFNTSNMLFRGADSDAIIIGLSHPENDLPLIAVSNGSACTSSSIEPSHVLMEMGLSETDAFSSIRFSLSKYNTQEEMVLATKAIKMVVSKLKMMI